MSIKPLQPKDVVKAKERSLPDFVIESINELIAENLRGKTSQVKRKDIVQRIKQKSVAVTDSYIAERNWLSFEEVYRKAGWNVKCESPSIGDNHFDTYYEFTDGRRLRGA